MSTPAEDQKHIIAWGVGAVLLYLFVPEVRRIVRRLFR